MVVVLLLLLMVALFTFLFSYDFCFYLYFLFLSVRFIFSAGFRCICLNRLPLLLGLLAEGRGCAVKRQSKTHKWISSIMCNLEEKKAVWESLVKLSLIFSGLVKNFIRRGEFG